MKRCATCGRRRKPAHQANPIRWCKPQPEPLQVTSKCLNCGAPEAHFVPPSLGEKGFFICDGTLQTTQAQAATGSGMGAPGAIEGFAETAGAGQTNDPAVGDEAEATAPVVDSLQASPPDVVADEAGGSDPALGSVAPIRDGEGTGPGVPDADAEPLYEPMVRTPPGEGGIDFCSECGGVAEDYVLDEVDIGVGIQQNICNAQFHDEAKERRR